MNIFGEKTKQKTVQHNCEYSLLSTMLKVFSTSSSPGLNIIHLNVQSLPRHIDELRIDLQSKCSHIILLSESWLHTGINNKAISIDGYAVFRNDRSDGRRGGGVCIYCKKSLKVKVLSTSSKEFSCEFLFIEAKIHNLKLLIGCIYNPPNCNNMDDLFSEMERLCPQYQHIVIGGDFNINILLQSNLARDHKYRMDSLGLNFVNVSIPTHFGGSPSLIDHLLVSCPDDILFYQQIDAPAYSKHDLLFTTYDIPAPTDDKTRSVLIRDFSSINNDALLNDFNNSAWDSCLTDSIDANVANLEALITQLYDNHVPIKEKVQRSFDKSWMTDHIFSLTRRRDESYKTWKSNRTDENWELHVQLRNQATSSITAAKRRYLFQHLSPSLSPKKLWDNLKSLGVTKSSDDSKCFEDPDTLANKFFNGPTTNADNFYTQFRDVGSFSFVYVSTEDVLEAFLQTKSFAIGMDNISLKFLFIILPGILSTVTEIFNQCITYSFFPSNWKSAKVVPVAKKNSDEFRPICILPSFAKVFERLLSKQINSWVYSMNLLHPLQSGFRAGHSCQTALLKVYEDIRRMYDKNEAIILVLIDFSKAFDCMDHDILVEKLKLRFGFSVDACQLICSYLMDRTSFVFSDNRSSAAVTNLRGVPQGSNLGPLLFSLYIEDIDLEFSHMTSHFYADDSQMYIGGDPKCVADIVDRVNSDLQHLQAWANRNALTINAAKSKCILFCRRNVVTAATPQVILNSCVISYEKSVNNLGVIFDEKFTWNQQCNKISRTINFGLRNLYMFSDVLQMELKQKLVKALFLPYFESSNVLIGDPDSNNLCTLQRSFNSLIRFVHRRRKFDHISDVMDSLVGMTMTNYLQFRRLIFLFNLIKSKTPEYLFNFLRFFQSERLSRNIHLPQHNYLQSDRCFFVHDVSVWNSLEGETKWSKSTYLFKKNVIVNLNLN